jgi:hypothetical protein
VCAKTLDKSTALLLQLFEHFLLTTLQTPATANYVTKGKSKVNFSLCFFLTEHHATEAYCGAEV